MIINNFTEVENLHAGDIALIITPGQGSKPAFAQACTVEAVYRDAPGWSVDYRYTTSGGAVLYGTAYFHYGSDLVDTIGIDAGVAGK